MTLLQVRQGVQQSFGQKDGGIWIILDAKLMIDSGEKREETGDQLSSH